MNDISLFKMNDEIIRIDYERDGFIKEKNY